MPSSRVLNPLTVKEPMVLLSVGVYRLLLTEAGYLPPQSSIGPSPQREPAFARVVSSRGSN